LMVRPGLINLDFADIRTAMMEMGKAMMGTGEGIGDKRAVEAAEAAINNPLLDDISMKGAHGVIINVTGGYDMTLFEVDEACNRIRDEVDPDANIIFGATFDENLEGIMRVSIVATGIEKEVVEKSKGGSGKAGISGKAGLERAKPQTEPMVQLRPAAPPRPAPSYSPSDNIRGITAPPVASSTVAPVVAYARGQEAAQQAEVDPELDMYDQGEFAVPNEQRKAVTVPQNTALRGDRFKEAFIPPKPVEVAERVESAASGAPVLPEGYLMPSQERMAQTGTSRGLQLNPPKAPNPERKRAPSLFERITGTVQSHLEGMREDVAQRDRMAAPTVSSSGALPEYPAQGRLSIDAPAAKPRTQTDEELDIPAFLRRQAN
ncbi:MAG: cell division protein FtsZ, partial [Alphaproteobacteria bacterium]